MHCTTGYDPFQMTTKLIDDTDASALKTALLKEESSISVKIKPISKAGQTRNEEAKIETIHAEYSL